MFARCEQGPSLAWHKLGVVVQVKRGEAQRVDSEGADYPSGMNFIRRKSPEFTRELWWESLESRQSLVPGAA